MDHGRTAGRAGSVRLDPFLTQIWAANASVRTNLSVWVAPLELDFVRADRNGLSRTKWVSPLEMP